MNSVKVIPPHKEGLYFHNTELEGTRAALISTCPRASSPKRAAIKSLYRKGEGGGI